MYRIRPLAAVGMDSSAATRAALIEAATPLFAAQGFEATRTREIADKARANVSAINYHFGSKMGLYQAVIRQQAEDIHENFPLVSADQSSADPATRLRWLVRGMLSRVLGKHCDIRNKVCLREFVEPTEALDFLVKEIVVEQYGIIRSVVSGVLDREVSDVELDRFTLSVTSQCYYYGLANPMLTRLGVALPETDEEFEALAEHIARFSLAGLRAGA